MRLLSILLSLLVYLTSAIHVSAAPESELSLSPAKKSTTENNSFTTSVMINSGTNQVLSGDVVVTFNPQILNVVSISKGDFLPNANVVQNKTDNQNGTVTYSFYTTSSNAKSGTGSIINIKWRGVSAGVDSVNFDPNRTLIYALNEGSALKSMTGGTYTIRPRPTPTGSVNFTPTPTPNGCEPFLSSNPDAFIVNPDDLENTETSIQPQGFVEKTLIKAGVCKAPMVQSTQVSGYDRDIFPFALGTVVGISLSMGTMKLLPKIRKKATKKPVV